MKYLVMIADNIFASNAEASRFTTEYPSAWQFDSATDAYMLARMLSASKHPLARAISTKAYDEEQAFEAEGE